MLIAAVVASVASTVSAEVPEKLRKQSTDTDAIAFFNAMDDFEDENRDGMTVVTYDSYPNGMKIISRRIDVGGAGRSYDRICAVFDSITATPASNRITVRNNDGRSQVRVYKVKGSDDDNTIDLSSINGSKDNTSACITKSGGIVIAQNWTVQTRLPQGRPDFSHLNSAIKSLAKCKNAFVRNVTFDERQRSPSGALRSRQYETLTANDFEGERIVIDNARVKQWIDLHHVFMESLGDDGNISLTYIRNNRMVTLVDMDNKTIYAARFRSNAPGGGQPGTLYILVGHYKDEPFLPDNWATAM